MHVTTLNPGYPGEKAELTSGDVILSVDGKPATDLDEFMALYKRTVTARKPRVILGIGSDLLTVREASRPDQKCRILKTWKQTDGTMAFEVQCLETEEHLTLVEMAPSEAGVTDPGKGMKSRIYHWGQSVTPPIGVPQMPTAPDQPSKDSKAGSET